MKNNTTYKQTETGVIPEDWAGQTHQKSVELDAAACLSGQK
jgi:hypothetical protein